MDAASPSPSVVAIKVTDALGASPPVTQRVLLIIDSQQGRIQPQQHGADIAGGDGATALNLVEGHGIGIEGSTSGGATSFTIKEKWQPRVAITVPDGADAPTIPPNFSDPRGDWMNIPVTGTITGWEIVCEPAGSAEITMSRCSRADYPTFTDMFTATISSDTLSTDTGLSHDIFAGDFLRCTLNGTADFSSLLMRMTVD